MQAKRHLIFSHNRSKTREGEHVASSLRSNYLMASEITRILCAMFGKREICFLKHLLYRAIGSLVLFVSGEICIYYPQLIFQSFSLYMKRNLPCQVINWEQENRQAEKINET